MKSPGLVLWLLCFMVGIWNVEKASGQDVGFCDDNQFVVDLSAAPDMAIDLLDPIVPDGNCCGVSGNYKCIELILYLHPDATAISIVYHGAPGSFYYLIDCQELISVGKDDPVIHCIEEPQEYYSVTFCRPGNPAYTFTVTSLEVAFEDVTLDAFDSVCADSDPFELTGGSPSGGYYHINGSDDPYTYFDPAVHGPGDHVISYWYFDADDSECWGMDEQILTVNPLPELSCDDVELCLDSDPLDLMGLVSSIVQGEFAGPGVFDDHWFNPQVSGAGVHLVTYEVTDPDTFCADVCTLFITVHELPVANNVNASLCDDGSGPIDNVDITVYLDAINNQDGMVIEFYENADLDIEITDPSDVSIEDGDVIYVLVTDPNTGCQNVSELRFSVEPIHLDPAILYFCDESPDGTQHIYDINVADFNYELFPGGAEVVYEWFEDASGNIPLNPSEGLTIENNQSFYFQVSDGGCVSDVVEITFSVQPLPELEIQGEPIVMCKNDGIFNLADPSYVLPAGGQYTGPGVSGGVFDAVVAGNGVHEILYTYTDGNGCSSNVTFNIIVKPVDPAVCGDPVSVCLNDGIFELTASQPSGGVYSGTGVTEDSGQYFFDPELAGEGIFLITYTITEDGCEDHCTFFITVYGLPSVTCPEDMEFCHDNGWEPLPDPPPGGYYSGTHVLVNEGEWFFDTDQASPGSYILTLHTPDDPVTGCSNACVFEVTIHTLPVLSWEDDLSFCPHGGLVPLSGALPQGGVYGGDYVVDGLFFDTDQAGEGMIHPISYAFTDDNGCTAILEGEVEIFEAPVADAGEPFLAQMCDTVQLQGIAMGGTPPYHYMWSPAALLDDPTLPDPTSIPLGGTTNFELLVTDHNGCIAEDQVLVAVENSIHVHLTEFDPVCVNSPVIELVGGSPSGGTYFINNDTEGSSVFIPSHHGPGEHQIHYVYTDLNGCTSTATQTLVVNPLPEIQWHGATFCDYGGLVELTGALPEGGTYSGGHVSNGYFNLSNAGAGLFSVNYTYIDDNGCVASASGQITVNELPYAYAGADTTIQVGTHALLQANEGEPFDYAYHWSPEVFVHQPYGQSTQTTQLLFTQIFQLTVLDPQTGCQATDGKVVYIAGGDIEISAISHPSPICEGAVAAIEVFVGGGDPPYEYFWYDVPPPWDPDDEHINPHINSPVFLVEPVVDTEYYLLVTDSDGNYVEAATVVQVNPMPVVVLDPIDPVCANYPAPGFSFPQQEGSYHLINQYGHHIDVPYNPYPYFNPSHIGEGTYDLVYTVANEFGCSASDTQEFIILPYVNAEFYLRVPDRCRDNEVLIRNNSTGDNVEMIWDFEGDPELPDGWTPETTEFMLIYPVEEDPQDYTITLTVVDSITGCTHQMERMVTVHPRARAMFSGLVDGCAPHTVAFEDESEGYEPLYYFWRFGDGSLSLEQNPVKTFYNYSGQDTIYEVSLTIAIQNYYCTETYSKEVTIFPQTQAGFAIDPITHCSPYNAVFHNQAAHADSIFWQWGDGTDLGSNQPDTMSQLTHVYTNLTSEPDTLTVIQTVYLLRGVNNDSISCVRNYEKELVVFPWVEAVIQTDPLPENGNDFIIGCAPFTVDFSGLPSANAKYYEWEFGDGGSSSDPEVTHTFYNNTADTLIREVQLQVETKYGCINDTLLYVHVLPQINASFDFLPQSGCSPLVVDFENTSVSGSVMNYEWLINSEMETTQESPQLGLSHDLETSQLYTVELIAENLQGCRSQASAEITVHPRVTAQIYTLPEHNGGVVEICASDTIEFFAEHNLAPSLHAHTYLWSFGDGDASSTAIDPEYIFHTPGTYEVSLEASSEFNCHDTAILTVIVHPLPSPGFALQGAKGCSPLQVDIDYEVAGVSGYDYAWDFEGQENWQPFAHDNLPESHTFNNISQAVDTLFMAFMVETDQGCMREYSRKVIVYPEVSADIVTDPQAGEEGFLSDCAHFTVTFDASASENATAYLWDFGDGINSTLASPVHTFMNFDVENSQFYDVMLTTRSDYNCLAQSTMQVEVKHKPLAHFEAQVQTHCSPAEVAFQNLSLGASDYLWDFGDGHTSTEEHPVHTFELSADESHTTFVVSLQVFNDDCVDVYEQEIIIYPDLVAAFEISHTGGCHPLIVEFTNATEGKHDMLYYTWDYGDGNLSSTAAEHHHHTFHNYSHDTDTVYTVTLTAHYGNACMSVFERDITVQATPKSHFQVLNSPGCAPHAIELENLSEGAVSYSWDFGDGSPAVEDFLPDPHTYYQAADQGVGTFVVALEVEGENGCPHVFTRQVTIYPAIESLFSLEVNEGCHPLEVEIENLSSGAYTFDWSYGDGNTSDTDQNIHHHTFYNYSHTTSKTFDITLHVESEYGCTHQFDESVTVHPVPGASFHTDIPGGCSPLTVDFTNTTQGVNFTSAWSMGDGSDTIFSYTPEPYTYQVDTESELFVFSPTLEVVSPQGCRDVVSHDIYVYPDLVADFEVDIDQGCHPLTVEITNLTLGDYDHLTFEWDYGDGQSSSTGLKNHSHTYKHFSFTQDTTFVLRLTARYADMCFHVAEQEITVLATPQARFSVSNSPVCSPEAVEVQNLSQGAQVYSWYFGDGSDTIHFADPGPYVYHRTPAEGPGEYTITLSVEGENGCVHHYEQQVLVFPAIEADFVMNTVQGCHPLVVEFTDQSDGAANYSWVYGDGHTSDVTQEKHTHTFENFSHSHQVSFPVSLWVESDYGCTDNIQQVVEVFPVPKASFSTDIPGGCSPLEVSFANTSSGTDLSYAWDMGQGGDTLFVQNPETQIYQVGDHEQLTVFEPSLWVSNSFGCHHAISQQLYVYPDLEAGFEVDISQGCHPLTVEITNHTLGDEDYLYFEWDYGDGHSAATTHKTHSYTYKNFSHDQDTTYTLRLTARYADVCVDVFETEITVLARPLARFQVPNSPGCAPHPIEVHNLSEGAVSYVWDFGAGSEVVTIPDPDPYVYTQPAGEGPGTFTIELLVEGANECTHQFSRDVVIFPEIEAGFSLDTHEGCHPLQVTFENTSSGGHHYFWDYNNGHTSETASDLHIHEFFNYSHTQELTFEVELTTISDYGCVSTFSDVLRVDPVPLSAFHLDTPGGCSPLEVVFGDQSVGATSWAWDLGDGTDTFYQQNPGTHAYYVGHESPPVIFEPSLLVTSPRGCTHQSSQEVYVFPDVTAAFTTNVLQGCHPLEVEFANLSEGNPQYLHFEWDYGDGNTSATSKDIHSHIFKNHSHTQDTTFMVTLTAYYSDVCYDVFEKTITVLAKPLALFSVPNSPVCAPDPVEIVNLSQGAYQYQWLMGDGTDTLFADNPAYHSYNVPPQDNAQTFTMELWVQSTNGCAHSYTQKVTVFPEIHALFEMQNADGCHPLEVSFENLSQGVVTYIWDMGDGVQGNDAPQHHTYLNQSATESKNYLVQVYATSGYGCEAHFSDTVTVRPVPSAQLVVDENSGCSPFQPQLGNLSQGGTGFFWDFGDENHYHSYDLEAAVHAWNNTGDVPLDYSMMLQAVNEFGCKDSTFATLTVFPEVTADFTTSDGAFADCSPFEVRFDNLSHLGHTYQWDFGDGYGSVSTNPLHFFKNLTPDPVTYEVQLLARSVYGCTDTEQKQIEVYPTPEAHFSVSPIEQPYPNATITLTNYTNPGQWDFEWNFGDGNTSQTQDQVFDHTYVWNEQDLTTKSYQISLRASNIYCYSDFSRQVTITSPIPVAQLDGILYGCEPLEVSFENLSLYAKEYRWFFGDGTVSYDASPVHIYQEAGLYDLMLIAIGDGGRDTLHMQVDVYKNPTADFSLRSTLINIPREPLRVVNRSKLAAYYHWDFGDGQTSTEYEPVYYYEKPGVYDITLTVYTDTQPQCVDVKVLENSLRVDEACQVIFPNAFKPSVVGPSGGSYDPAYPTNEVFHPLYEGVESYELEVFTRWGELIYRSTDPDIGWDGYVGGKLAPSGVYVWRVHARCASGYVIEKAGDVTLIR